MSDLAERDKRYVLRPWSDDPLMIVDADDCTVTDDTGKQYVDFTAGYYVNNAGHCRPEVMAAARDQLDKVTQVSGKQGTPPQVELAELILARAPKSVGKVLFSTGGSEANEFALKMVRQATGKPAVAAIDNCYHGLSLGPLELCANQKYRETAGVPIGAHGYHLPSPYCYRCPVGKTPGDCATECLDKAEQMLDARPDTAAIIAEPIQAVGGIIPPAKWWDRLDAMRRKRGLLLVADEVMAGVGRTGTFFSAEHYGLEPDVMSAAKGLSGGVGSVGVTLCSDTVGDKFRAGTTPTNGGNAVSAAAGVAMLDVIDKAGLMANARRMGEYMTEAILRLDDPWVGDVRLAGLLGCAELVLDRATKAIPNKPQMEAIRLELQRRGFILTITGPHANCLRIQPPLTIQPAHVDALVAALADVLPAVRAAAGGA